MNKLISKVKVSKFVICGLIFCAPIFILVNFKPYEIDFVKLAPVFLSVILGYFIIMAGLLKHAKEIAKNKSRSSVLIQYFARFNMMIAFILFFSLLIYIFSILFG